RDHGRGGETQPRVGGRQKKDPGKAGARGVSAEPYRPRQRPQVVEQAEQDQPQAEEPAWFGGIGVREALQQGRRERRDEPRQQEQRQREREAAAERRRPRVAFARRVRVIDEAGRGREGG